MRVDHYSKKQEEVKLAAQQEAMKFNEQKTQHDFFVRLEQS